MLHARQPRALRTLGIAIAMVGLVGSVAPGTQASTKHASHTADISATPSSSLVLPGTLKLLAWQRAQALERPNLNHPNSCPADPGYIYNSKAPSRLSAVLSIYGDPGVYISIALTAGATAQATWSGTTQAGVSVVIANASVTYGIAFSFSITASVTYTGAWTVPTTAPHYGYLGAGAQSDSYNWSYGHYVNCVWVVTAHGVANSPYHLPYIWKGTA